jgi:hypothetical protein
VFARQKLKRRNKDLFTLKGIDEAIDSTLRQGYEPGDPEIDSLLYDRTVLFDVLVAQGAAPWEYTEKTWLKS